MPCVPSPSRTWGSAPIWHPALRPPPAPFLLKMDKQGEVTVFVQNQLKRVSLALSCVPWWPKHLGRQKPKRIFPMLCKKSCLPNPTLKQIPDKLNATILCSTPPPWQISSYSWEHSPVSKKGRSLRSLLSCSRSSPPCRWGCKLAGGQLAHPPTAALLGGLSLAPFNPFSVLLRMI